MTILFPLWDVESSSVAAKFTLDPGVNTTITTAQAHSPTHSLLFTPGGDPPAADLGTASSNSTIYYKFYWWLSSTTSTGGSPAGHHGFRFTQRGGGAFTPHHEVDTFPGDSGTWGLDILDHDGGYDSGTAYHNLFTLPLDQWFLFEALFILSSPGTPNGRMGFKVNGSIVYNSAAIQYVGSAGWVGFDTFLPNSNWDSGTALWYLDDLYVSNVNEFDGGDTTNPVCTITTPTSAASYSTGSAAITIAGTASDDVAVSTVTWTNNGGGSSTATGTTSWTFNLTLSIGTNVILVTATDSSSNVGTDTIIVTYIPQIANVRMTLSLP